MKPLIIIGLLLISVSSSADTRVVGIQPVGVSAKSVLQTKIDARVAVIDETKTAEEQKIMVKQIVKEETITAVSGFYKSVEFLPTIVTLPVVSPTVVEPLEIKSVVVEPLEITPPRMKFAKPSFFWQDVTVGGSASFADGRVTVVPLIEKQLFYEFTLTEVAE